MVLSVGVVIFDGLLQKFVEVISFCKNIQEPPQKFSRIVLIVNSCDLTTRAELCRQVNNRDYDTSLLVNHNL